MIIDKLNSFLKSEPAQLDVCSHAKEFIYDHPGKMERTASTNFSAHTLLSLKKLKWLRQGLVLTDV